MEEKRSHKRYSLDNMSVKGNLLAVSEIDILNISLSGIAIRCDKRIDLNREYTLHIGYGGKVMNIRGRVVWSIITGSRLNLLGEAIPIYTAGMEFVDVMTEKMSELIDFIESHKIKGDNRLTGVRFKIKSPEAASLDYPYSYTVKEISLSGMLIETDRSFDIGEKFEVELFLVEKRFHCLGRVAFCSKLSMESPLRFDVGIAFSAISDEDKAILKDFINTLPD